MRILASLVRLTHRGDMRALLLLAAALLLAVALPLASRAAEQQVRKPETQPTTAQSQPDAALRRAIGAASCTGEYADDALALSTETRELERLPETNYSYCLRNTAIYECLSYGSDGKVQRRNISVQAHGTAFAYKVKNGEYYLLTNEHVANWPLVTDDDHTVDDVPEGCKKVDEQLRLVRDEADDYEPGQIPVQRVVTDPFLDAAVLKTHHQLNVLPYRIGHSALLRAGNAVQVRGYPLGLMEATNSGKVVTPFDLDREKGWNHVDFVTDALVTKGNSGSPVFAISCHTGSLELVGLYHAGYRGSPALNVVVGIDQLHDLMENFRRSKAPSPDGHDALGPETHGTIVAALQRSGMLPFFNIGDRIARARLVPDSRIAYDIFAVDFPSNDAVEITLEEAPDPSGGALESVTMAGGGGPTRRADVSRLDAESQDVARSLFDLARRQFLLTMTYRTAAEDSGRSREASRRARDLQQQLDARRHQGTELLRNTAAIASRIPILVVPLAGDPQLLPGSIADVAAQLAPPITPATPNVGATPVNQP